MWKKTQSSDNMIFNQYSCKKSQSSNNMIFNQYSCKKNLIKYEKLTLIDM